MPELYALPGALPLAYDAIAAAGVLSPGVARVSTPVREYVYDEKEAPGAAGVNVTFKRLGIVSFTITCDLWTDDHLALWEAWVSIWEWDPTKDKPRPVDVLHPILAERGVFVATARKIFAPEQVRRGDNLWRGVIDCTEWRPPPKKNVTGSPNGSKSQTPGQPSAADKRDKEIAALLAEAKKP